MKQIFYDKKSYLLETSLDQNECMCVCRLVFVDLELRPRSASATLGQQVHILAFEW